MMKIPKPHWLLVCWTPDEAAECLDGVSTELARKLWNLCDGDKTVADVWHELDQVSRLLLNELADEHDQKYSDFAEA